jgi:hypothetical protein
MNVKFEEELHKHAVGEFRNRFNRERAKNWKIVYKMWLARIQLLVDGREVIPWVLPIKVA